jgi:DNA-binding transcriptional ArsR family regulator
LSNSSVYIFKWRPEVFQAIADPTRREIINLISHQPMNLNAIAEKFDISRPAILNHIKILSECGIISVAQVVRERFCKIQPGGLIPAFL